MEKWWQVVKLFNKWYNRQYFTVAALAIVVRPRFGKFTVFLAGDSQQSLPIVPKRTRVNEA